MNPELIKRIRELVSQGKYEDALSLFDANCADSDIIALKSRLKILEKKKRKGSISFEQETTETNRIVEGLLDWSDKYLSTSNEVNTLKVSKPDPQLISLIKNKLLDSLMFYYIIAFIPITAGITLAIFFFLDNGINVLEGLGSTLTSSISGLSIREIMNRKDRISFLEILLTKMEGNINEDEIRQINELAWSVISDNLKTQ